jgi:hypothetical protein
MRLVTYDEGAGPRVGRLEDERVVDLGFDGDMVTFIAAGGRADVPADEAERCIFGYKDPAPGRGARIRAWRT